MEHATFDDPKLRWRKGSGINVPVILKFTTRRTEAVNVKERVGQTGINVRIFSDDGKRFAKVATSLGKHAHPSARDTNNNCNKVVFDKLSFVRKITEREFTPHNMTSVQAIYRTQSNTLQLIEFDCVRLPNSIEHILMD